MEYQIKASSISNKNAAIQIKKNNIAFGTTAKSADTLPNPAELFLGAFASCMLKNVERFSAMMKFNYVKAIVNVSAKRTEKPLKMDNIDYRLTIYSSDENLNIPLLKKNIEKFGTIYNTVKLSCNINGIIEQQKDTTNN
ncbi:putative OsmC-like protein [Oceanihabitans sediminis]|uniref:OsmC family peroxiredoxin n=1 Tax=Oceanihabitans sediminis TaxID=1812012 RepID=A0A368P2D7_9FLAO|nr:OsmC family protein [Oceanihabitans sediminis]MDX1774785.1 OsmC family protein [Oceanihabitans sediminis]RBP27691.1 putative OsmC-like protein [Oceanihabitans sediminis]RCU56420.1 OsmC family peroxiredoxin [Oceanihabitans sediminis]